MIGKATSKAPEMLWWEVVKTRDHGGHIHGARREVGDKFQASETAMTFEHLEGLVEKIPAPASGSLAPPDERAQAPASPASPLAQG